MKSVLQHKIFGGEIIILMFYLLFGGNIFI